MNGMDPEDQRNFIIAMVLMIVFVFGYQALVVSPGQAKREAAQEAARAEVEANPELAVPEIVRAPNVEEALTTVERLPVDGARMDGSLRLTGGVVDDVMLKDHYTTVEKVNELRLMRPSNAENGFYAAWYWFEGTTPIVGPGTQWQVADGVETLTTDTPVTLVYETDGLRFERVVSVDDNYMFTFADTVINTGDQPRTLMPLGSIRRHGQWKEFLEATDPGSSKTTGMAFQGMVAVFDGNMPQTSYKNLFKGKSIKGSDANGVRRAQSDGWVGLSDKYWMAAIIPEQGTSFDVSSSVITRGGDTVLQVRADGAPSVIQPGASLNTTSRIFTGAKEYETLKAYKEAGIPRFDDAIDWGNILYYITKPLFTLLNWLKSNLGSFGLAILALTLIVKIPLIPLYNQSYKSMAKMKKLSEPMKEIQERFAGDPQRKQQEVMKLYQREKANPIAGCIPILFTIPIFFALYKTLYVTIEMRHAPFLYFQDLSAPDPTAIGNLFGLLPWAAADVKALPIVGVILGIGVLPILYGVTMSAIQSLSPPPPDATQKMVMRFLPLIFMFVFAGFAAGLVLYWVWSNILSLIQQYFIMRRNGVETEFDKLLGKLLGRKKEVE